MKVTDSPAGKAKGQRLFEALAKKSKSTKAKAYPVNPVILSKTLSRISRDPV